MEKTRYAKVIGEIGEEIGLISNRIGVAALNIEEGKSAESLQNAKQDYLNAVDGYKKCKEDLIQVMPPNIVGEEHKELIETFELFIQGTEEMFNGINIEQATIDFAIILEGRTIQKNAETRVEDIGDRIVKKLLK
ncbi:hypothetical protein MHB77_23925 [Paenibacillus sp. FSL K6-3166]|uniref:hypothetical protein n=1 Tax=unclassified Paenibacillus TaxID=185978 RepID=UPI000BA04CD1|nr:hypothetical protein [Paenibacillus sp. VTT E-133291]OZQ78310.1 hypothetical protein CA598_29345 [Paenibacillus sp. VTT E-133291]